MQRRSLLEKLAARVVSHRPRRTHSSRPRNSALVPLRHWPGASRRSCGRRCKVPRRSGRREEVALSVCSVVSAIGLHLWSRRGVHDYSDNASTVRDSSWSSARAPWSRPGSSPRAVPSSPRSPAPAPRRISARPLLGPASGACSWSSRRTPSAVSWRRFKSSARRPPSSSSSPPWCSGANAGAASGGPGPKSGRPLAKSGGFSLRSRSRA
mmetsp:Transcript_147256/g.470710  ORF Transcript_147256/g.470710 Transcript_147256/m.470710 type:complete len:210 (+) Transcript_147256:142-771(+)